ATSNHRSKAAPACDLSILAMSFTLRTKTALSSSRRCTPISVMFTLPEQNLSQILNEGGANGGLRVLALDRGNTNTLDEGTLAVVDNEIDPTTGTVKLKATFPNDDLKLWPGKFVNARLVLTTRKDATVIPSSVVQRGPQGTYAYLIKPDKTVEMRPIKVAQ